MRSLAAEQCGRGFAVGFALLVGFGVGLEEIHESGSREGCALGFEQLVSRGGDAADALGGLFEGLGLEDRCELGEGEAVELAEFERA